MNIYSIFQQTDRLRISDGAIVPILSGCDAARHLLIIVCPQLGDFDSLEYAWWLQRERAQLAAQGCDVRMIGIGDRAAGLKFCEFTGFPTGSLFIDREAKLHTQLDLYPGLSISQNAWVNLMLMCAGIGSPGTLREVLRGYTGDRSAPQLIAADETVAAKPLPPIRGSFFDVAGGSGFQRPFELATLRLRNMAEVLGNWSTYVPDPSYLTQRGGTFLFAPDRALVYAHRDRGILGFAANMSQPLAFLAKYRADK
ncbi:peroxiredoxin-like family protein [Chamaesiphon sp. VAR_69_metabat_338]|uniref:peroxiredoxin-like family protein n=1 Tax=Chamaesiphon sp. VAR_69_metabat_338 TaxID=2964704 RepID=UPI00286E5941|nr:peroxiredoxin-like family protein [Chamaesiphon sp. VAR_69_metabat_338]